MINQITLIGFIGKDAETKALPNTGRMVTKFSVATSESWKDEQGEWQSRTQWHSVIAYGDGFSKLSDRLLKGVHIFVQGQLQTREYERTVEATVESKKVEVSVRQLVVEVKADKVQLLYRQAKGAAQSAEAS
jgi:single-strand DNA-binding protein